MEMNLTQEETNKLNNLWKSSRFQRSWRSVKNTVNCGQRVKNYFVRNIILLFFSFIVGGGLFLSKDLGLLPDSIFIDKLMMLIARLILFILVLQILSVLIFAFIGPSWESNQRSKLRRLYESEILTPILQIICPSAKIDIENDISPNNVEEVVPVSKYYIQSGIIKLNSEKDIEIVDLYAHTIPRRYHHEKKERKYIDDITNFIGQVYSIKNTHPLKGTLRIVPTKYLLNIETTGGYLTTISGGKKIDIDDVQYDKHYNTYCTDEQSAVRFLTPTVIEWFNNNISDCRLSLYSNESRIYIANYNNRRLFAPPKDNEGIHSWSIEKVARNIKYALAFANNITEIM